MIVCDSCTDATKDAQYVTLSIVTHDKLHDTLESFEHDSDLCDECRVKQRQAIEEALGVQLVDVSPTI